MCGIAGILNLSGSPGMREDLESMVSPVIHRGPDGEGLSLFDASSGCFEGSNYRGTGSWTAGLAHRRLAIIDLSDAGHQPMCDSTRRYWLVYNGEIYNYLEIRNDLSAKGCVFRSRSDSEVVLNAYIRWGPKCLERFNGMWAFAVYDAQSGSLFCARDRLGIKPFYFVSRPGVFAFASEIKQLLTLPWVRPIANRDLLGDFFLWGFESHTDETFFADILSLPGGHYQFVTRETLASRSFESKAYWQPSPSELLSDEEAVEAFRDLLADSVRLRLRSDVPVGVTLSGGLDSSSVVCMAGAHFQERGEGLALQAFNVEFEGSAFSERRFAEAAARMAGARIIVLRPSHADLAQEWARFIWHMEEPFGSLSFFSNYQIYHLIRESGIPVVLSGQGGDELLLGYDRYRTFDALFKIRESRISSAISGVLSARSHARMPLRRSIADGLYFSIPFLRIARRRRLVKPVLDPEFYAEFSQRTSHLQLSMNHEGRESLQQAELRNYQLPHLLRHEDRVSMAHSVETRLPFLDYRLLDLVTGQSADLLFRDGWSKYILRQAMEGILPDEVTNRTDKMGFETPTGELIRRNAGVFRPLFNRHRDDTVLNVPELEREFDNQRMNERLLCSAVSYLSWKETFAVA